MCAWGREMVLKFKYSVQCSKKFCHDLMYHETWYNASEKVILLPLSKIYNVLKKVFLSKDNMIFFSFVELHLSEFVEVLFWSIIFVTVTFNSVLIYYLFSVQKIFYRNILLCLFLSFCFYCIRLKTIFYPLNFSTVQSR